MFCYTCDTLYSFLIVVSKLSCSCKDRLLIASYVESRRIGFYVKQLCLLLIVDLNYIYSNTLKGFIDHQFVAKIVDRKLEKKGNKCCSLVALTESCLKPQLRAALAALSLAKGYMAESSLATLDQAKKSPCSQGFLAAKGTLVARVSQLPRVLGIPSASA